MAPKGENFCVGEIDDAFEFTGIGGLDFEVIVDDRNHITGINPFNRSDLFCRLLRPTQIIQTG